MSDTEELEVESTSVEESVDEPSEGETGETPTEYRFKYDDKDVVMSPEEFAQFYGDWENSKKWKATLNEKGQKLNRERDALRAEREQLKIDKSLVDEYRQLKEAFQANPEAYKQVTQLLNERKPALDPAIQEIRQELKETRGEIEREKAIIQLSKELKDFDYDTVKNFMSDFDFNTHYDTFKNQYYAWLGSQLDEKVSDARADVVRKAKEKKGLPSTGKKEAAPAPKPKTIQEMVELAHKRLEADGVPRRS